MNRNIKKILRSALVLSLVAVLVLSASPLSSAATVDNYPGASAAGLGITYSRTGGDGNYSATVSESNLVCTSTGYTSWWTGYATTMVITFTNNSSVAKTLSFSITRNNTNGSVTVSDAAAQSETTQNYTRDLAVGASCTVTLVSPKGSGNSAQITISGIALKSDSVEPVNVTFATAEADAAGTVTGSCSQTGNTVAYTGDISGLTVTPATGYVFYGWVNTADGSVISTEASGFVKPDAAITVRPSFVPKDTARFSVDGKTYYYWEDAFTAAAAGGKKVIVSSNGFLPGGKVFNKLGTYVTTDANGNITYNVPSDCSLVIPRASGDTGTLNAGDNFQNGNGTAAPTAYRTFTVQSGAKIVCDGELNVNGQRKEKGQGHVGQTMGTYGRMVLQGSSTQLEVNGTLYCYGYISGTGTVEVNGTIYELLEMGCWNGGSNALSWSQNASQDAIFMISQYFVQNVEAPLKLNGGCTEYLETVVSVSIKITEIEVRKSTEFVMPYGNSKGLFLLPSGSYLLREHDHSNDRVTYTLGSSDGTDKTVGYGSITIEAKALGVGATISSSSYTLPIPNNMTIKVGSNINMTMTNRVAVLPGGSLVVDEGAKVNMTNHLYVFGKDDWNSTMYYQGTATNYAEAAYYNTTRGTTRKLTVNSSAHLQIDGILHLTGNGNIYTTGTGGNTANTDKVIYGKGTIINEGTLNAGSLKSGYNGTLNTINVTNGMARLAGTTNPNDLTSYAEMGNSTYYGLGDAFNHFWYETKTEQAATCTQEGGTTYNVTGGSGLYIKTADKLPHSYDSQITDATCTENGSTVYTCTACGDSYTKTIEALGHNHVCEVTTEASCTSDGLCIYTCSVCGHNYSEVLAALGHADCKNANGEEASDHFCDHCHLIMYYATNVRLGNSLDMMFAFPKDVFPDEPNGYYIKVVRHYADGSTKDETYSYLHMQWTVTEGFIYITYTGIAAKEMCDKIEVTVYNSQDVAVSITWEDSIRDYAMRLLEKHENNRALCTLLVDMLNYGAACQDYLNYGVVDLANALLSDVQIGYASTAKEYTMSSEDRPGWKASQLVVESNILYNIIFDTSLTYNGASVGTDELYVRYSYVGHKGNREVISERVKISDMKTVEMNGTTYHYIPIEKMVVADAAKADFAITITITDLTENTIYAQWTDSLRDYTARITDDHEVYSLFMQFAESAYTYLHTEEARI